MEHTTPRQCPISESTNRPNLLLSADRELVFLAGMVVFIFAYGVMTLWALVAAVILWLVILAALVRMAKADPLMRAVYLRHLRYQTYYPAKSGLCAQARILPMRWLNK